MVESCSLYSIALHAGRCGRSNDKLRAQRRDRSEEEGVRVVRAFAGKDKAICVRPNFLANPRHTPCSYQGTSMGPISVDEAV